MANTETAYQYDAQGMLIGETLVQQDPMNPGEYLLPPDCTLVVPPPYDPSTQVAVFSNGAWKVSAIPESAAPAQPEAAASVLATPENRPEAGDHQVAIIVDGVWQLVADFRDTTYWLADGSVHRIVNLGETLPADALSSPPAAPAPTEAELLANAKATQLALLNAAFQKACEQPVSYTSQGGVTQTWQADSQSVSNLSQMLLAFQATKTVPDGFYWVAADNVQVPFTYADMENLAQTIGMQGVKAFQTLQTLKAQVNAASTVEAVQVVVWVKATS